ncbi:MAG: preprotein translocase subunit SecG [Alphaproteobacteria bacterium 16-39-46]|nr:MAG: preprotein translocase subunit SecG [Alphaproteobacteria bacterium 16-39-46]OZA41129.1 MAG: preprotein translocase subunit SecG [Alphaproteobacteria bacterium 17-39-52]HQS84880.1 preprotein translocase subunit SecG [Alphaproteobacteria bacterium]HQS94658.1 preprotein translocase subunit SecG [Alphaproteobacteria bacterium]
MQLVLIVIHLMIALAMVGIILIQRSEGGGLSGLGGGSGGFLTTRGTANLLTRTTAVLAGLFMLTSLVLTILAERTIHKPSILNETTVQISAKMPVVEEKLSPPVAGHKNQTQKES